LGAGKRGVPVFCAFDYDHILREEEDRGRMNFHLANRGIPSYTLLKFGVMSREFGENTKPRTKMVFENL